MKIGSCLPIVFSQVIYSGGYSDGEPPLPIPNREAKPVIADGTARPGGRVGSCRSSGESSDVRLRTLFFLYWGAAPNPDAPRGLCVLHVFAVANTRTRLSQSPDPLSKGAIRACGLSIAAWPSLPASSGPASDDALVILRSDFFACLVLKKVYHYCIHDAMLKSLIINTIGVFRVGVFITLKTVKRLSLSNLHVALPSIKGRR